MLAHYLPTIHGTVLSLTGSPSHFVRQQADEDDTKAQLLSGIRSARDAILSVWTGPDINSLGPLNGEAAKIVVIIGTVVFILAVITLLKGMNTVRKADDDKAKFDKGKKQLTYGGIVAFVLAATPVVLIIGERIAESVLS